MSNCYIIHGSPATDEEPVSEYAGHFMPWLKRELDSRGIDTKIVLMPEPWKPQYDKYLKVFSKLDVNEDIILVGHSSGGTFLIRWLSELDVRIKKLVIVAPWIIAPKGDKFREAFYDFSINEDIRNRVKEIVFFTSNNEEKDGKISLEILHNAIGGKIISLNNRGHYCIEEMESEEVPDLLKEIVD